MVEISVITPAYNCSDSLKRTLEAFRSQTIPREQFELIVINDGSTDGIEQVLAPFIDEGLVTFLSNPSRKGVAAARNRGLDAARGKILLFLDGDNVPQANCLEEHIRFHREHPEQEAAMLGCVSLPRDIRLLSPLMRLDDLGRYFKGLKDGHVYGWKYFGTMHISLKRSFADIRFNEHIFKVGFGFEDTEFGFRLSLKGMRIIYNAKVVSYHYHVRTPQQFLEKIYRYGKTLKHWIDADPRIRGQIDYIHSYVPYYKPKPSLKLFKCFLYGLIVNDLTARMIIVSADWFKSRNEAISAFLYERLYNHFFFKGFNGKKEPSIKIRGA